ncbi:zinc finger BED domain-containing protein 4-like [Gordionus sp. m RMFG-2023]|uniref:zinc finger BED domain-containing protein 4-like n=1 Tax=Gordionus sp. m RMFG-2023 TaxID=3053472 RepID=UPI0031FC44AE
MSEKSSNERERCSRGRNYVLMCCLDLLPFDSISNNGMTDFLKKYKIIDSSSELPNRTTISRGALDDVYCSIKAHVLNLIDAGPKFCSITFDLWTDHFKRRNYITFSLHHLDENFDLKYFTLATRNVTQKHTGETILSEIDGIEEEFHLKAKIIQMVTDAGANVKRSVRLGDYEHHLCLGHGLHNLVTVDEIISALRYRVADLECEIEDEHRKCLQSIYETGHILDIDDSDPYLDDHFDNEANNRNVITPTNLYNTKTLKLNCPTRWHSILIMLESVRSVNKNPINNVLNKIGNQCLKLFNNEWDMTDELYAVLIPFLESVEYFYSQKGSTINLGLLFRSEIETHIQINISDSSDIICLKENMQKTLDHRFPITELQILATLLNPRFQNLKIVSEYLNSNSTTSLQFLTRHLKLLENDKNAQSEIQVEDNGETSSSYIAKIARKHSIPGSDYNNISNLEQECHILLSQNNIPEEDALTFWKKKQLELPRLANLARKVLCISATSTPSERIFSIAGLILNAKRTSLCPTNLDKILFIHDNYNLAKSEF